MNVPKKEKIKYDAEYISYIESGESAAVFITRDIVKSIRTEGKWVDVISIDGQLNENGRWDFNSFSVELFPRQIRPIYPQYASDDEKKYITWQTAHADIQNLRSRGYKGVKFEIFPKLVNANRGKYKTVNAIWNKSLECWVPRRMFVASGKLKKTSSFEWRKKKIPKEPEWEYHILKIRRL